jgi:hypothetical protein
MIVVSFPAKRQLDRVACAREAIRRRKDWNRAYPRTVICINNRVESDRNRRACKLIESSHSIRERADVSESPDSR